MVRNVKGWLRDLPDCRDTTLTTGIRRQAGPDRAATVASVQARIGLRRPSLPEYADNEDLCSPVEDQGNLGSCTAQAGVGLVEFIERRDNDQHVDASRRFLYWMSRLLDGLRGDTGAYLRTTMKALVMTGVPPERYWKYDVDLYDEEPPAWVFSLAQNYKAIEYMRLDGATPMDTLLNVKAAIAERMPVMFGFSVFSSLHYGPEIPYPTADDYLEGGHAVLAVGYRDAYEFPGGRQGGLLIRNSWGQDWGEGGYGWLPYDYVTDGLADDFWTACVVSVDTGEFD